jgi:hypothetical protein
MEDVDLEMRASKRHSHSEDLAVGWPIKLLFQFAVKKLHRFGPATELAAAAVVVNVAAFNPLSFSKQASLRHLIPVQGSLCDGTTSANHSECSISIYFHFQICNT